MKVQFYGKIKKGKWSFNRKQVFNAFVQGQPDGDYCIEMHKTKGPSKTMEQLGYYYAVIIPTIYRQLVEDGHENFVVNIGGKFKEVPLTADVVDLMLKETCAGPDKSKAKMSKQECSEFIDKSIRWAARWLSCVIPPPDTEKD